MRKLGTSLSFCLNGGIGRHKRLKISRPTGHAGSSPASGTIILFRYSSMVERPPVKRIVPGSSPGAGAI